MSIAQRNIIIVEDDEDTADLLTQQLDRDEWTLRVARNGQEAILITGESPPDLFVMDLMMPHLDGFETTRFVKAKFRGRYVPVLVLTAKGDAPSRARGARFGAGEYLTKPYDRKNLLYSVKALLAIGVLENTLLALEQAPESEGTGGDAQDEAETPESEVVVIEDAVVAEAAEVVPDAPDAEPELTVAERSARIAEVEAELVSRLLALAERQIADGRGEVARSHVARALALDSDSDAAKALSSQLEADA